MTTYSRIMGLLALCTTALVSCHKELISNTEQKVNIGFTASLVQTKTSMGSSGNLRWDANDKLKVRQIYYRNNKLYAEVSTSGKPTANGDNGYSLSATFTEVTSTPDAHFTGGYRYMYQGFYPETGSTTNGSTGAVTLTLPFFQTPPSQSTFDPKADLLYSDAVYAKSQRASNISGRTINGLTFHRINAVVAMTVSGAPSSIPSNAKVRFVEFTDLNDTPLAGAYTFGVANPDNMGSASETSATIRMNVSDLNVNRSSFKVCFTCLPATCTRYKVKVVTDKGSYEKTFTNSRTFALGTVSSFTASMSNATVTPVKRARLVTYNVAAFRLYEQHNLKQALYRNNRHYWKPSGSSSYVLYTQQHYDSLCHDVAHHIDHAAGILSEQFNSSIPMMVSFNELDNNMTRNCKASAKIRHKDETTETRDTTISVHHGNQIVLTKSAMERITNHDWYYHFTEAISYNNVTPAMKYGNGVASSIRASRYVSQNLGKGGNSKEENRVVVAQENADCVFASVHMGGVSGESSQRIQVINNQMSVLNDWFMSNFAGYSKPVFLCGDFNAYASEIHEIVDSHWTILSTTSSATHSNGECLDYILCFKYAYPAQTESSSVITTSDAAKHGVKAVSDHYPLMATVKFSE
ncbi:MAG: hypothetical protein K5843_01835 [Bacteroidales bacterium]|nr:hypothetical protein [Bacteroidales bacterium]